MEYKIDGVETSSTYSSVSNLAMSNVYEFTGLESNTTYTASIKIDTVTFGESESSDTLSFTTNTILYDDLESIEQLEYVYVRLYIFLMCLFVGIFKIMNHSFSNFFQEEHLNELNEQVSALTSVIDANPFVNVDTDIVRFQLYKLMKHL